MAPIQALCGLCDRRRVEIEYGRRGLQDVPEHASSCIAVTFSVPCRHLICPCCLDKLRELERSTCHCCVDKQAAVNGGDMISACPFRPIQESVNSTGSTDETIDDPPSPLENNHLPDVLERSPKRSELLQKFAFRNTIQPRVDDSQSEQPDEYYVTHVSSPSLIYLQGRDIEAKTRIEQDAVERQLRSVTFSGKRDKKYFDSLADINVVIRNKYSKYRGQLVGDECNESVASVRLLDTGKSCKVSWVNVEPMPETMRLIQAFCFAIALDGIVPAGSSQSEWSISAKEKLSEIVSAHEYFYLKRKKSEQMGERDEKKIVGNLLYVDTDCHDPFGAPEVKLCDVGKELVKAGLALHKRDGFENGAGTQPLPSCAEEKPDEEAPTEGSDDDEEDAVVSAEEEQLIVRTWRRPVVPTDTEFKAVIMYIDTEGQIQAQPSAWHERIAKMEADLTEAHKAREMSPHDLYWNVGDSCVGKYPSGNASSWHRCIVTKVDARGIIVLFVDYGETKRMLPSQNEVHKDVLVEECLDIPIACLRFKLDRISPRCGKYEMPFLDEMHRLIVDKTVSIKIVGNTKQFPLRSVIHLKDETGEFTKNLAKIFQHQGDCRTIRTVVEWSDSELKERLEKAGHHIQPDGEGSLESIMEPENKPARLPSIWTHLGLGKGLAKNALTPCEFVDFENDRILVHLDASEEILAAAIQSEHLLTQITENQRSFDQLMTSINEGGSVHEIDFESLRVGDICAAKYSSDGRFYRAQVRSFGPSGDVNVLYIDYGNGEVVPRSRIKGLPAELTELPSQVGTFKVRDIDAVRKLARFAVKLLDPKEQLVDVFRFTVNGGFEKI